MNKKTEKLLGALIRDITKVGSMPKSEVRKRINEILKVQQQDCKFQKEQTIFRCHALCEKEKKAQKQEMIRVIEKYKDEHGAIIIARTDWNKTKIKDL